MNATVSPPFTDVPEQIVKLIYALCVTVAERCGLHVRTLTVAQENYINGRLLAARKRFRDLLARIRAGKPPKPRPRKPKPPKAKPSPAPAPPEPPLDMSRMPKGWRRRARADLARERRAAKARAALEKALNPKPVPLWRALRQDRFGWLCPLAPQIPRLRHSAPGYANHLRKLLADPEMQALLKAHRCLGESLRSVCHALGVERSLLHLDTIVAAAAAPEPVVAVSAEIVPAMPPDAAVPSAAPLSAARVAPDEKHFSEAAVPTRATVAHRVRSFHASAGARPEGDFFQDGMSAGGFARLFRYEIKTSFAYTLLVLGAAVQDQPVSPPGRHVLDKRNGAKTTPKLNDRPYRRLNIPAPR